MSDNRPRTPDRKFALIAPIVIGAVAVLVLVAVLLRPEPAARTAPEPPPPVVAAPPAKPAAAAAPASRADLISAAAMAASAFAAGEPAEPAGLVGRRFRVRLAFGCNGPALDPGPAQAYYQVDATAGTAKLVARPAIWSDLPLIRAAPAPKDTETVEGFWIPRPWLMGDDCPQRRQVAPPATPTPVEAPSLGLAMFHAADASRAARRGERPYEQVIKLASEDAARAQRFVLVLEGRVSGFADGAALHCWSESAEHRPICLYAVDIDRVAFEAGDGTVLADWPA